jgi:hypothetical protein
MKRLAMAVLILVSCGGLKPAAYDPVAQQPVRDPAPVPKTGTASIAGIVVTDESPARPARRAIVTLAGGAIVGSMSAATDDDGRFAFEALPPDRYTLTAAKPSYLNGAYGASRPGRPGTPIQLANGEQLRMITIKLAKGAVVTGMVRDQNGDPVPSVQVSLLRYVLQPQSGERVLQPQGPGATTDDRGTYRIFGIAPGEFYAQLAPPFALPGELRLATEQSMQAVAQQLRAPAGTPAPPLAPAAQPRSVAYTPIFFPNATSIESAAALRLAAGEERGGVDIQLQMVPTAKIEGVVFGPDGAPAPTAQVTILGAGPASPSFTSMLGSMFGGGRPNADGQFTLSGIAPGRYTIAATTGSASRGRGAAPAGPMLWATAEVDVNGQDVSGVRLTLEPGMRVSGRVMFEGATPPQDLSVFRVGLTPLLSGASVAAVTPAAQPDAQGRFTFESVTPGRYRWSVTGGANVGQWTTKSASARGRDTIDTGVDVRPTEPLTDVTIALSDRSTSIQGTLQDTSGRPAADYFIVVYARDRALQSPPTRRVVMTRPASDGKFTVNNLPPGEYLLAATTDLEQGEWRDPAFLAQLVSASIPVTLAEGETKQQDIRIAR